MEACNKVLGLEDGYSGVSEIWWQRNGAQIHLLWILSSLVLQHTRAL
jgi:hypothetical protein